ncbi:MAG: GspH/FimT family pseudopilin [Betaproteobacteria bacterium]
MSLARGFTLIEILVVVLVLGIATVVASANLFQTGEEKLQQESEKLLAVLQLARDEAAFGGRVIAVTLNGNELQFLERDFADPSKWNASKLDALKPRPMSETFKVGLRVGNGGINEKDNYVTFLPIGVASPFEFELLGPPGIASRKISGDAIGNMTLVKAQG